MWICTLSDEFECRSATPVPAAPIAATEADDVDEMEGVEATSSIDANETAFAKENLGEDQSDQDDGGRWVVNHVYQLCISVNGKFQGMKTKLMK